VARRDPEVIVASWCGKKARGEVIAGRPGFAAVRAVREGRLYEVKSSVILQPGPAALEDGVAALAGIVAAAARGAPPDEGAPAGAFARRLG
jgi:iron complex transport system substrate-binding protein